jgi:hypothetical protein
MSLSERRTPIRKSVIFGCVGNCTIRFLPGKLVAISTYTSFSWCFLLLFMYTVIISSVPICNFQAIQGVKCISLGPKKGREVL